MRVRLVKTLKGGETLAENVITEEKEILISKGTVLKPEYLDLISFLGIDTVCIKDPYESYEVPHQILSKQKKENYIREIQKLLENHIYHGKNTLEKMKFLAENIVEDLLDAEVKAAIDMEERNGNLYEHTFMVTILSVIVGIKLKLKKEVLYQLALGCLLHDLGLRYITVSYMNYDMDNSPSSEIFEFKKHTILAYSSLESENWLSDITKKMILSHHERKDGSGFPLKQKTKEIECCILQACDTFDCLISGMECKRKGIQETLEYLVEASDVLFDGRVIKLIQKIVARYPVGTRVKLTSGESGIVMSQTEDSICPVIGILDEKENLTEIRYYLNNDKQISILQTEN